MGKEKGIDLEKCKDACDKNPKCNFIFWNEKERLCFLHETCDEFTTPNHVGTVFAKSSCPKQQGIDFLLKKIDFVYLKILINKKLQI